MQPMLEHLLLSGLPHINHRQPILMVRLNFGRHERRGTFRARLRGNRGGMFSTDHDPPPTVFPGSPWASDLAGVGPQFGSASPTPGDGFVPAGPSRIDSEGRLSSGAMGAGGDGDVIRDV